MLAKYHRLGFDFTLDEVVSSRDVAFAHLPEVQGVWAAITSDGDDLSDAPAGHYIADLHAQPELMISAAAFLFLSSARWSDAENVRLERALQFQPRPVIVANPDLVAPRDHGLSREPGWYAQDIATQTGAALSMFGKPFSNAFDAALPAASRHSARAHRHGRGHAAHGCAWRRGGGSRHRADRGARPVPRAVPGALRRRKRHPTSVVRPEHLSAVRAPVGAPRRGCLATCDLRHGPGHA